MSNQVIPEPLFALDLISYQLAGNTAPLSQYVSERVNEPTDLAIIDASMLLLIKTLERRVRQFANIQFLSPDIWRAVIALSKQSTFTSPELNSEWLLTDTDEFLSEVVSPMVADSPYELVLPGDSNERSTPDDEYLIHAFAVVNVGLGFVRGVSSTIPNYGSTEAIIGRLREYFVLLEARGEQYDAFKWDDE